MGTLLAKVNLANNSNLPEDVVTNQFVVGGAGVVADQDAEGIAEAVRNFYISPEVGTAKSLSQVLGHGLSRAAGACEVAVYDITAHLDGSPAGSPVHVLPFTLNAPDNGQTPLPNEVAVAVTLEAIGWEQALVNIPAGEAGPKGDIRPKSRRRGRLFIGPLTSYWVDPQVQGDVTVDDYHRGMLLGLFGQLRDDLMAQDGSAKLQVWSRADEIDRDVVSISIDNRFDTIRSRGAAPTARTRVLL